jgi:hypothetical protein
MGEEPAIRYTMREMFQRVEQQFVDTHKKLDSMQNLLNEINLHGTSHVQELHRDLREIEPRLRKVEAIQVGQERISALERSMRQNSGRVRLGAYGLITTGAVALIDFFLRVFHK